MEKEKQIAMAIYYSSRQNHSHWKLQILFSNTKIVIDQHGNRQSKSVKLKTYLEYSRIESVDIIIFASKITQMIPSTTQDHTAKCVQNQIINSSWQRIFLKGEYSNTPKHRSRINYQTLYKKDKHKQYKTETEKCCGNKHFRKRSNKDGPI